MAPDPQADGPAAAPSVHELIGSSEAATEAPAHNSPIAATAVAASVSAALEHPASFFVAYAVLAIPTYLLPYYGSNSAVLNGAAVALGVGALPQYWLHLTFLFALAALAWIRGGLIGRSWLPVFPVLAGIFDMTPGLNWFPLIPTAFHVTTLIIGVTKDPLPGAHPERQRSRPFLALVGLVLMVLLTAYKWTAYNSAVRRGIQDNLSALGSRSPDTSGSEVQATKPPPSQAPASLATASPGGAAHEITFVLDDTNARSIWSTSVYSYAPGGGGPGGGMADDRLRVGGSGDTYVSLIELPLPRPQPVERAVLSLHLKPDDSRSSPTPLRLMRIAGPWRWQPGDRLWWKNLPPAQSFTELPAPPSGSSEYNIDITSLYNDWVTGRAKNFGLMLAPSLTTNNFTTFYSTRASTSLRPALKLTVQ